MKRRDGMGQSGGDGLAPEFFRAFLDHASDAIEVTDQETLRFLYANEAVLRMHGYSREELLSMSIHDLNPYISKAEIGKINKTLKKSRSVMFEGFHRHKDGSKFPVEVHISLVRIDNKDWRLAVVRDISERKKAEADLQLFRTLLNKTNDAIEVIDPETLRYLDANEAACRNLGYTREELLSMSVWDVDTGMDAVPMDKVNEALRKGKAVTHESFHRRKDGSTFPVEVVISQVRLDKPYNIAVARDISERKRAEAALHEREASYRTLAENIPGLVYRVFVREQSRMQFFNEGLVQMTGYAVNELTSDAGMICSIEPLILAEDRPGVRAEVSRAAAEGRPFMVEYRLGYKQGDTRWMIEYGTPIRGKDGSLLYIDGVIFDNTERKRAERLLQERERQLQEAQEFGHLGHWSWDSMGNRAMVSDEVYRIFGYAPRAVALSVEGFLQTVHSDDREMVRRLMKRAVKTGESTDADFRVTTPSGEIRWIHEESTTTVSDDRTCVKVFGICQDITERKHQAETLRQSLEQSILTIADAVEARDPYTAGHQRRVGKLAMAIAREMELPEEQVQGIYLASLIHDLGKIHIPAEILTKPGRLSEVEYLMMKTHPQAGYDIIKNVEFPWPIADIVLQHHERLDGSGYPQGLKDGQILIEARIIAVADVVESMTSHRPYREGLGVEVALEEIEQHRGGRYDPEAVDACLKLFRQDGYVLHD